MIEKFKKEHIMDNLKEALKWYSDAGVGPDEYNDYVDYGALARKALEGKKIPKHRPVHQLDVLDILSLSPQGLTGDLKNEIEKIV